MFGLNPLELIIVLAVMALLFGGPPWPPWVSNSERNQ
jgi:hypothetical protein